MGWNDGYDVISLHIRRGDRLALLHLTFDQYMQPVQHPLFALYLELVELSPSWNSLLPGLE